MKKRFACLMLALALLPAEALAAGGGTERLITSYDPDNYLELTISGDTLTVEGRLRIDALEKLKIRCGTSEENVDVGDREAFSADLALTGSEPSRLEVYYATSGDIVYNDNGSISTTFHGYLWDTVYVEYADGGYRFMKSKVLDDNLALRQAYADPARYCDASRVPAEVKAKSDEIVAGETDDYAKLFKLHKWVAENIYYDYDSFYGRGETSVNAGGVLANKRSICSGFATLLKNLILAQGIPAMKISSYALGLGIGGSFAMRDDASNLQITSHAHVEAYVDGRWIVMDPTWDSKNRFENGAYITEPPTDFRYFDITPEMMAMDHQYFARGDDEIHFSDGVVVGADPLPVLTAEPTSSTILVNGKETGFDAYNINGSNYFKLRDLASVLSGTEKQFEVTWDQETGDIGLLSMTAYTPAGGEMARGDGVSRDARLNTETIYLDGCVASLTAYTINNSNYFKLRDLGSAFDFDVTWDGERNTIIIDTSSPYTPD